MPVETEFYDRLKVNPSASIKDIKKAYRELAKTTHPDKGGDEETFKKINEAYETLSDEKKKEIYDRFGKKGEPSFGGGSDIFSHFFNQFGGGRNSFSFGNGNGNGNSRRQVADIIHNQHVTLEQLCKKETIKLKYKIPRLCTCVSKEKCRTCNGAGMVSHIRQIGLGMIQQSQSPCGDCKGTGMIIKGCSKCKNGFIGTDNIIEINLEPSMQEGHQCIYKNQGNQNINGDISNFIAIIKYSPHKEFKVQNGNLVINRTISLEKALKGYKDSVIHPSGKKIDIDTTGEIINPYDDYVIQKMGITEQKNLIIKFKIQFPKSLENFKQNFLC